MPGDLVDAEPDYARRRDLRGWEALVREVFDRAVLTLRIPADGAIVELGTARAINFQRLCELFGPSRCRGYDVSNALGHPRVLQADVRELGPDHDVPVALGWNDLSDWELSPASKAAGRRFVLRNLVPGGLYVDAGFTERAPPPASLPELDEVARDRGIVVWRRRGEPAPASAITPDRAWWQWLDRMLQLAPWPCRLPRPGGGALVWSSPSAGPDPLTPEACAAAWCAGSVELDGRLRWLGQAPWPDSARPLAREDDHDGRVLLAGGRPQALELLGRGRTLTCELASGDVLVVPPGWSLRCRVPATEATAWCVRFEHQPAARWVSLPRIARPG